MSVSTVQTDTIYLGFNPTSQCQSAQFPQIPYIWALTLPASQCQSAQLTQISSIWALTNQPMSVSTVSTDTIYVGFNFNQPMSVSTVPTDTIYVDFNFTSQCQSAQFPQIPSIWALTLPANVSHHSSHKYHPSGL